MFNIGELSNKIGDKLSVELNFDKNKKDVVTYGIFALLQIITSIVVTGLVGIVFGVFLESIIVSFTIAIYRKYAGGVHANTPNKCLIIGAIVCVIPIFIANKLENWNFNIVLTIVIVVFIISYYIVFKYAPVDSIQKPIRKETKKKRLKKGSLIILSVYLSIVIVFILLYNSTLERNYINFILSICIGVIWQTFTLTKMAHLIFRK